jgi:serine/threonine protein kinase
VAGLLTGKTLKNGDYEIQEIIGRGGMATVYLGYQKNVERQVAIKVLSFHTGVDDEFKERFQLEARTIARLQHPHILSLHDYGAEDDLLYLVMAYLSGGTFENRITKGEVTLDEIERVLREIGGAIDYAHRQGIVHRDIKPANILLDSEGHALLTDFGIAKLTEGNIGLTGTNVVGTPAYMSPEQAQGMEVTGASDIYSLGVVVFQALTGKLPFNAPSVLQIMLRVVQDPIPDLEDFVTDAPPQLNHVLSRALAKDPDARYATAQEFADAFTEAIRATSKVPIVQRPLTRVDTVQNTAKLTNPLVTKLKTDSNPTGQTVIVQQSTNPLILLGGFAIIAIALVALVVIIMSGNNSFEVTIGGTATPNSNTTPVTVATRPTIQTFGRVSYTTTNSLGDTANIRVDNLQLGGDGVYIAWLINTAVDTPPLNVGELTLDALGSATLRYVDETETILPSTYNALLITRENNANIEAPSADVRYSAQLPASLLQLVTELLIASPDGVRDGSLLSGITLEATIAAQHAGLAAGASTAPTMHIHAEHTINILKGEMIDYDGSGRGENPGRGIGIYIFADKIEALINTVLTDAHSTPSLESNAEFIRVCLQNTRQRADEVVRLEQELLTSDNVEAVNTQATNSSNIADEIINGVDLNQNGDIEAFEGECGLAQIEIYALLVGTLDVVEGGLN